ncbi:MAG: hypothetical protein AABW83_04585 [Nanoarchaeota archaeon]
MKINIKEILFWISLIIAILLLLWFIFGNSPTEFFTILSLIFMIVLKMWTISDKQLITEMRIKSGFENMKKDIELIKNKLRVKQLDK